MLYELTLYKLSKGKRVSPLVLHFTDLRCNMRPVRYIEDNLLRGKGAQYDGFHLCELRFNQRDYGYGKGKEPIYAGSI